MLLVLDHATSEGLFPFLERGWLTAGTSKVTDRKAVQPLIDESVLFTFFFVMNVDSDSFVLVTLCLIFCEFYG